MALALVVTLTAACAPTSASPSQSAQRAAAHDADNGAPPTRPAADDVAGAQRSEHSAGAAARLAGPKLRSFSRKRAMRHVRHLAGRIGTRVRAHRGERRAALYVASRFRRLGYRTKIRTFPVDGATSRNVVAWWPGASRYPVVVGAHMDTVPGAPGANDNASGVAVLLETARLVAGKRQARFLRLVAFGSEEYGANGAHHVGSQSFVARLGPRGRRKLAGMLSIDMVADGRPLLVGSFGIGPRALGRLAYRRMRAAGIKARYTTLCDCSDNGPFERAGIPAGFMYSGAEPNYHSPSDTPRNLVPRDLVRSGRAVKAFVKALRRDLVRRLRRH